MESLQAPEELKKELIAAGMRMAPSQGTFLFRRGDSDKGIFLVIAGKVRLGLGKNLTGFPTRELGPGAVLGLPATLSHSPYSLSAEVIEDSDVVFLSRTRTLALLREHTQLCFEVMSLLSEELARTRSALSRIRKVKP
ncbi:MAG TPA: Crp/Fnr family transcriptional regulator [Terriglobales bacterium]|nr:Crp/Fnr family transcriptional regulator [Terriglobales bacterium]